MIYLEEIRELTKSGLEKRRKKSLESVKTEIKMRAEQGQYNAIFYCYDINIFDFIVNYLEKEGFFIKKFYHNIEEPNIKIEW